MNRILIIDENIKNAQTLGESVRNFDETEKTEVSIVLTVANAISCTRDSIELRQPYNIFLLNRMLDYEQDSNNIVRELLSLSPDTDVVIFNSYDNANDRIQGYEAGVKRYILQNSDVREVIIVLNDLVQAQKKKRELEYKSIIAAQTSWAAELAHEINQEVYKIQSAAYLLKNGINKPSEVYSNIEIILNSSQILADVGRYSNQSPTEFEVDEDIRSYVKGICSKKGIDLRLSLQATEARVLANRIGFRYVFKQLIDNALLAMKDKERRRIYIRTRLLEKEVIEIRLRDTGLGIGEALRTSIFQSPVTTKDRGGYGLLLVRQLVEDMKGEISLEPFKKDRGTEFVIKIPSICFGSGDLQA